jgi:hypothetical protein
MPLDQGPRPTRPSTSQSPPPQAPPATSGASPSNTAARILQFITKVAPVTLSLGIGVALIDAALPDSYKLTTFFGELIGRSYNAETKTTQDTAVENTWKMTDASASAQTRWQMELIVFQEQQRAIYDAIQGKVSLANVADWTCALGPVGVTLFYGQNTPEARDANQLVRQACGYGMQLRQEIVAEQAQLARLGSAIQERQIAMGRH